MSNGFYGHRSEHLHSVLRLICAGGIFSAHCTMHICMSHEIASKNLLLCVFHARIGLLRKMFVIERFESMT